MDKKTTVSIDHQEKKVLRRLAELLGIIHDDVGNISGLLREQAHGHLVPLPYEVVRRLLSGEPVEENQITPILNYVEELRNEV